MIRLKINDKEISVEPGTTVMAVMVHRTEKFIDRSGCAALVFC